MRFCFSSSLSYVCLTIACSVPQMPQPIITTTSCYCKLYVSSRVPSTLCPCSYPTLTVTLWGGHWYLQQIGKKQRHREVNNLPKAMQLLNSGLRSMFYCFCPSVVSSFSEAVIFCGGGRWSSPGGGRSWEGTGGKIRRTLCGLFFMCQDSCYAIKKKKSHFAIIKSLFPFLYMKKMELWELKKFALLELEFERLFVWVKISLRNYCQVTWRNSGPRASMLSP